MAPSSSDLKYKVKLSTGRILGPIDLERIGVLIRKNQIVGTEIAREHPLGDWRDINLIEPIAELLIAKARGTLKSDKDVVNPDATVAVKPVVPPIFRGPKNPPGSSGPTQMIPPAPTVSGAASAAQNPPVDDDRTWIAETPAAKPEAVKLGDLDFEPLANVVRSEKVPEPAPRTEQDYGTVTQKDPHPPVSSISRSETIMIERPQPGLEWKLEDVLRSPKNRVPLYLKTQLKQFGSKARGIAVTAAVGYIIFQLLATTDPAPKKQSEIDWVPIRPALPALVTGARADPTLSAKLYIDGLKYYIQDTVSGYKASVQRFTEAARADSGNVKALALLASSYLNLIDSSNKDENYFNVISKLIELSRAKNVELPETVIADVEFYITVNKAEAAQTRIVDYTRVRQKFGPEMYYYLALAFFHRGDTANANRYINEYQSKPFSAKLFLLRGQIAEKLGDASAAIREYEQGIQLNPRHGKSHLAIANVLFANNHLQEAAAHLQFLTDKVENRVLLSPTDLARAYYLHGMLNEIEKKDDVALAMMERAVRLDRDNHEYLLELYMLRGRRGASLAQVQPEARMYFFLGEGEKYLKDGNYHEALTQFLQARQANGRSFLPLVKIGDMFLRQNDLTNARLNYKAAAERAPTNIEVWSKYINVLIQSYEWQDATAAMDRFRKLPVNQSAIDKAAADMYAKQGLYQEAQTYYRKAMGRDSVDSSVYIAYAKALMETKNYKEAPFFFALALRFDPLNVDALVGTARCIAATDSIDRGILMLQDELQKGTAAKAELLGAIAELQTQKGAWDAAQQYVEQAKAANSDYAYPWKIQAAIYMNRENTDRTALDKALEAYNSYSDRNQSDPSGYLERYRIFVKKGEFDKASDELGKVFGIYPKFPNLHFYKGALYAMMKNDRAAIEEYRVELSNNPNNVVTLVALGRSYIQVGAPADALQKLNKAMGLNPRSVDARAEAAYANFLLKNYQGAIALYQTAIALEPGNPAHYKRLGMVYKEMGDAHGAAQAFHKYLEMDPDAPDKAQFQSYR